MRSKRARWRHEDEGDRVQKKRLGSTLQSRWTQRRRWRRQSIRISPFFFYEHQIHPSVLNTRLFLSSYIYCILSLPEPYTRDICKPTVNVNIYTPISQSVFWLKIWEDRRRSAERIFIKTNNIFPSFLSGCRKQHGTLAATLKVLNDFYRSSELRKKYHIARFYRFVKSFWCRWPQPADARSTLRWPIQTCHCLVCKWSNK